MDIVLLFLDTLYITAVYIMNHEQHHNFVMCSVLVQSEHCILSTSDTFTLMCSVFMYKCRVSATLVAPTVEEFTGEEEYKSTSRSTSAAPGKDSFFLEIAYQHFFLGK